MVLAVLVLASLEAALGWAAAADEPVHEATLPERFSVPAPRIGDRILVTGLAVDRQGDRFVVRVPERPLFEFEWVGTKNLWDREGQPAAAASGQLLLVGDDVPYFYGTPGRPNLLHIASNGELLSYEQEYAANGTKPARAPTEASTTSEFVLHSVRFAGDRSIALRGSPCGLRHGLQGTSVVPMEPIVLLGRCTIPNLPSASWATAPLVFRAAGTDAIDGRETVAFTAMDPENRTVNVWLSSDSPYPVQISIEDPRMPGTWQMARLHLIRNGTTPILEGEPRTAPPAPTVELGERKPWGIDDTGVEHPFLPSRAYQALLENPDNSSFRDFSERPGAYVETAWSSSTKQTDSATEMRTYMWGFKLVADNARHEGCAQLQESFVPAAMDTPVSSQISFGSCTTKPDTPPVPPSLLPDRLPTARSTLRAWTQLGGTAVSDAPPTWTYVVRCQRPDCSTVYSLIRAGSELWQLDGRALPASGGAHFSGSALDVSPTGEILGFNEIRTDFHYQWIPAPKAEATPLQTEVGDGDVVVPQSASPVVRAAWTLPDATTTGTAAVLAGLLGLVYWLWPHLKAAGLFGLFSRVQKPKALDNTVRSILFEAIQRSPGIHFQELCRVAGVGHGAVQHHLDQLRTVALITRTENAGYHCYFPAASADRRWMLSAPLMKSDVAVRVLHEVAVDPEARGIDIARRAHVTTAAVSYHLKRFRDAGLIETTRARGRIHVRLTETGRTALANVPPIAEPVAG